LLGSWRKIPRLALGMTIKRFGAICSLVYSATMQYVGRCLNFIFLPVASNDNDDLLSFALPHHDLALIQEIKDDLRYENALTGMLLRSRKERKFFQECVDAERYILLRYFTFDTPELTLRKLKRYILDTYLMPKNKRRRKNADTAAPQG
jgi:hypothetical protein